MLSLLNPFRNCIDKTRLQNIYKAKDLVEDEIADIEQDIHELEKETKQQLDAIENAGEGEQIVIDETEAKVKQNVLTDKYELKDKLQQKILELTRKENEIKYNMISRTTDAI
jgi:hypothetical protein